MTTPPPAEMMIGKYQILELAGEGAMGCVYRARDTVLNRFVAIKVMNATIASDTTLRDRFLREAQSAGSLQHPNVVTVFDFGEVDGHLFIAMEFVEGRDLEELLTSPTPPSLEAKLDIMIDALTGLAYAHQRGIVHRDLKPANIRVTVEGRAKLMDFGVAHLELSSMTKTGTMVGTPGYMAPEYISGTPVTTLSDIFSMGAVLHHLLTGVKPFEGESLHAVLFSVVQKDPPLASSIVPSLPSALDGIVRRALAKDPAERYQSALDMATALTAVRAQLRGLPANATQSLSTTLAHRVALRDAAREAAARTGAPGPVVPDRRVPADPSASQAVPASPRRISKTTALVGGVAALVVIGALGVFLGGRRWKTAPSSEESDAARQVASSVDVPSAKPPLAGTDTSSHPTAARAPETRVAAGVPKTPAASPNGGGTAARGGRGEPATPGSVTPDTSVRSVSRPADAKVPASGATTSVAIPNSAPVTTAPPTTTPATVPSPPVPTSPLSTAATSETPARNVPNELRDVIARYAQAISARDLAAIRAVYPRLTNEQQRGFEQFFASTKELQATLSLSTIDVTEPTAEGRVSGVYAFTSSSGRSERQAVNFRAAFERRGEKWVLSSVK